MVNLILGCITGIAGTVLFFKAPDPSWVMWILFISGTTAVIFSFDVLFGSIKEHEKRAALLGVLMFGVPGVVLIGASWILAF